MAASLKLNPVPITSRSLSVLKIRWGLVAIGEPAVLELLDLAPERLHTQDDVGMRIEAVEKQGAGKYVVSVSVVRDLANPEPHEIVFQEYDVELVDEQGRPFRQQTTTPSIGEHGVQLKVAFLGESPDSQPAKLRLHYPKLRASRPGAGVSRRAPAGEPAGVTRKRCGRRLQKLAATLHVPYLFCADAAADGRFSELALSRDSCRRVPRKKAKPGRGGRVWL